MLRSITLKNLATISDTSLEFQEGLNVLTGETGSGKSILVDGLMLATGKRADRSMVRPGARNAFVEAVFTDPAGEETVIRREVSLQGKSRIFIDDSLATLEEVRNAVQHFVELHSQRSTPVLLKPSRQLDLLDRYAGNELIRAEYAGVYSRIRENREEMEILAGYLGSAEKGREILLHEMDLFRELKPTEEDYGTLASRERELRNAVDHAVLFSGAAEALQGDEGVLTTLNGLLRRIRRESPESTGFIELLEQAVIALDEASSLVTAGISAGEDAPELLAEIETRLDGYSRLMSRFGGTIEAVMQAGSSLETRLEEYESALARMEELEDSTERLSGELARLARELTNGRTAAGERLAEAATVEMKALNMPMATFSVEIRDSADGIQLDGRGHGPSGADRVLFMFTANTGIPMDTLESVASGGELSRVALALALAMADTGSASTLIFDEIDSGTGGETAGILAGSLLRASGSRQIIVISHLAQIASRAHRHLAVEKNFLDGMPVTTVKHLDSPGDRVVELARLLGGGQGARDHAESLLESGP